MPMPSLVLFHRSPILAWLIDKGIGFCAKTAARPEATGSVDFLGDRVHAFPDF